MDNLNPFLSFVVAARNDNHGGNFLHRVQIFVNVLLSLWAKYDLNAELVIIEWNPPEERPRLKDSVTWPKSLKPGEVRIIEVPKEIHHRLPNHDRMPMFEYIAKNVGIRRARGQYVLATNPDILFNEETIKFFASKNLLENSFYRADRYDVGGDIPLDMSVGRQLRFCARHAFRVNMANGTISTSKLSRFRLYFSRNLRSFSPDRIVRGILRRIRKLKAHAPDNKAKEYFPILHTNTSGDFFLMARQYWQEVKGYPELKSNSFIDGYACFLAAALGLKQVVLKNPLRIYHQEHDRSAHANRPITNYQQYLEQGNSMLMVRRPKIFNDENWGLGNEPLPEILVKIIKNNK